MIPELPGAVPEIPVSDVLAATEYYRDMLGFSIDEQSKPPRERG